MEGLAQMPGEQEGKIELRNSAIDNDWEQVRFLLDLHVGDDETFSEYVINNVAENGKNILHFACEQSEKKGKLPALKAAELIFSVAENIYLKHEDLRLLLDKLDIDDNTPICIAAENGNNKLVRLLARKGADVNLPKKGGDKEAIRIIQRNTPRALLDLFDEKLKITEEEGDDSKDCWIVEWNFTPITGVLQNNEGDSVDLLESQTALLSHALYQKKLKRSELLLHPLVRLFMHYKYQRFKYWIAFSIFYHILWSVLCGTFVVSHVYLLENRNQTAKDCAQVTDSSTELNQECNPEEEQSNNALFWFLNGIFCAFYLFTFAKECLEFLTCPTTKYYIVQLENWGQGLLFIVLPFVLYYSTVLRLDSCSPDSCESYESYLKAFSAVSVFIAGFLVLGQFNKTESLGLYMEMFLKVTKNVIRFLMSFSPVLITFVILFKLTLPDEPQFWMPYFPKLFAMMTGELNYDEVFHDEGKEEKGMNEPSLHRFITQMLFLFFVLIVVVILQNLLIALFISDIQELKIKAEENHCAKQLETICLLENFLLSKEVKYCLKRMHLEKWLKNLMVPTRGLHVRRASDQENEKGKKLMDYVGTLLRGIRNMMCLCKTTEDDSVQPCDLKSDMEEEKVQLQLITNPENSGEGTNIISIRVAVVDEPDLVSTNNGLKKFGIQMSQLSRTVQELISNAVEKKQVQVIKL